MCYDEGEATTLGRLIAEPLHNTFYMTDMVDYTVINDYKTHHQMRSLYLIKTQNVIQDNLSPLIQNI